MKYLQIPECLWPQLAHLSGLQAGIWADAWTWAQQGQRAFRTNDQLAEMFQCNKRSVQRAVKALNEAGYIELKYYGKMRYIVAKGDRLVTVTDVTRKGDRSDAEGRPIGRGKGDRPVTQVYQSKSLSKSQVNQEGDLGGNEVILPFEEPAFAEAWKMWKDYKRAEFQFGFKSEQAEQLALVKLKNETSDVNRAIEAIGQAMANGWKSIQPPKARSGDGRVIEEHSPERVAEIFARSNF
jgi:hypothetical protein